MFEKRTRRPTLLSGSIIALAFIAMLTAASLAQAQFDDDGDFNDGNAGQAPNQDSEHVPGLGIQMPSYGGTGCPQGSVSAVLSPDQKTLSVLFDSYIAHAGGATGADRSAVNCQLNIPFTVPAGYRVQVVKLDYRGYSLIPKGARSTIVAGVRYLEIDGRPIQAPRTLRRKVFVGPRQENFQLTSILRGPHWSPCGKSFVLAAESNVHVQTSRMGGEVLSTIDSLDAVQLPVQYALRWQRCDDRGNDRIGPPGRPDQPHRPGRPEPPGRDNPRPPPRHPVRGR